MHGTANAASAGDTINSGDLSGTSRSITISLARGVFLRGKKNIRALVGSGSAQVILRISRHAEEHR